MRIRLLLFALMAAFLNAAAETVYFAPQWIPQSQFAGFYAAYENGFYEEEGLDVRFVRVGLNSSVNSIDLLEQGRVQIAGMQTMQAIVERSNGEDIVNVMQITQKTGLCCLSEEALNSFADLDGKKIGKWRIGFSEICEMLVAKSGISIDWIEGANPVNLFVYGAVDAVLCYSYSELLDVYLAEGELDGNKIIRFADYGDAFPEDGIYVTGEYYRTHKETVDKFVSASKRGWEWVRENIDAALDITEKYTTESHIQTNRVKQRLMLEEYLRLQDGNNEGTDRYDLISKERFDKVVNALLDAGYIGSAVDYNDMIPTDR